MSDREGKKKKNTRPTVYESAADWWLVSMLVATPLFAGCIGVYLVWIGQPTDATWLFLTGALAALMTVAFAVPCRYTILDDALSIRCGVLFYQVPLDQIVSVDKSSSWLSGPALSLKRIAVKTRLRTHLISPKQRDEFLRELRKAMKQSNSKA